MPNEAELQQFLREHEIPFSGCVAGDGLDQRRFYVFVEVNRDRNNLQTPTNSKLNQIRDTLKLKGLEVDFILIDEQLHNIEVGIRATLIHSFGSLIRNVFISSDGKTADIWLVQKRQISDNELSAIQKRLDVFLQNFDLSRGSIYRTNNENTPSKTACIKVLRRISPADLNSFIDALRENGFTVPSESWMSHMADSLRKSGLIIRLNSGKYALSLGGLTVLGSAKNAKSPDISRLLALARSRD
jgi:hypothetical protein